MIKRGDIYFIRDTRQSIGSEQKADRPAVIVSNDANNKHSGVYEVVYMTTQPKTDLPTHFITSSALRTSTVLCEQISSVYEERIGEWIGTLTPEEMKQLDECLKVSVGINIKAEKEPAEIESLRQQLAEMTDRQQAAEKQAKTYKEMYADQTPFDNIDEAAEFPDVSTPQFEKVDYKVKKKGGILKITQELLDDTAENIISYLKKWIAKKAKATRNFLIVAKIREITTDAEVAVDSLDDLKKIFNVLLDPAIALTAGVVTNQDGYNWLDSLKDKDGKYILQPDPTKPTSTLLFGKYPVKKVSNRTMPSKTTDGGYKVPIACGDLKEAITIFDRETLTIDISSSAGKLWETDQTGIKVRERLDIKAIDEEAIVMAEHTIKTTTDVQQTAAQSATEETKTYTQAEIEKMSRENIIALGTQLGYTMTTTASDEKSAVVADFMAQQTAAQNK